MSHTLTNVHGVKRIDLEASRLWPEDSKQKTVTISLTCYDGDGGRHQLCVFCPDGMPRVEFTSGHRLDIPLHRHDGNAVAAHIVVQPWQPMNITLDEPAPTEAERGIIPFEDCRLLDDGTLDTVIGIWCDHHGTHHEHHFNDTSDYRDEKGNLDFYLFYSDNIQEDDSLLCEEVGDGNP